MRIWDLCNLTEKQQDEFIDAFYSIDWAPDDGEVDYPWGAPWYFLENCEIEASTLKEAARLYFDEYMPDEYKLFD